MSQSNKSAHGVAGTVRLRGIDTTSLHILSLPSLCAARGATGAVVVPCMVPQAQLSHRTWCHRGCCRAARGVAGAVIRLRGHVVTVAMPRAVSRSLLSQHVMLSSWSWLL